jgi:poly(A) polymerase
MTAPRIPKRPLWWSDTILDLQEIFITWGIPCYIVGGAVRDAWLHYPIHDLDLATPQNAIQLARRLANHLNADIFVMDEERDVARVLINHPDFALNVDIVRFRGDTLAEDLLDRDFTINAMAVDMLGDVNLLIDPLNGEADLDQKIIRQCNPNSIMNDPVRGIRAVRQSVGLTAKIEPNTLASIRAHADKLIQTSPERIRDEFIKLLDCDKPHSALRILDTVGLFEWVLPAVPPLSMLKHSPNTPTTWAHTLLTIEKLHGIYMTISPHRTDTTAAVFDLGMMVTALDVFRPRLQNHIARTWANDRPHKALLMLGALIHLMPSELLDVVTNQLKLSNDEKKCLVRMLNNYANIRVLATDPISLHYFWRENDEAGIDACLLALAYYLAYENTMLKQDDWLKHLEKVQTIFEAYFIRYDQIVAPPPLINGDDITEQFNIPQGKQIGRLLTLVREAQVLGQISTRDEAIALIQNTLNTR